MKSGKPNVVLILNDDMGYSDIGCYGGEIETPNLDRLAANGLRFSQFYNTARCSPSRASMLTGLHPHQTGVGILTYDSGPEGYAGNLNHRCVTIPQALKRNGYRTYMSGKWHVASSLTKPTDTWPMQRGFDEFYGYLPFGLGAMAPQGPPIYRGTNIVERPANHMEQFCAEALSFIDRRQGQPFFLYLPFPAVHGPMVAPEPWFSRMSQVTPLNRRKYAADLAQMDDIIGRVMARLRERGLEERTLVFFFSDNGGAGGATSNGALRGTKWTLWDGGIHVPFIAQWKGRIPAGRVVEHPVIQIDVLPTAIAAAGAAVQPDWKLDGANLLPCLEGKTSAPPHDALYWRFGVQYAVRQGDWKLVKPHVDSAPLLFNIVQDPGEKNNLAAARPEDAKRLQALWDAWNANNETPRWIDPRWDGNGPRPKADAPKKSGTGKAKG